MPAVSNGNFSLRPVAPNAVKVWGSRTTVMTSSGST
jgi:hypothetical protein